MHYEYDLILKHIHYCYDGLSVVWQMIRMRSPYHETMLYCDVTVTRFIMMYDYLFLVEYNELFMRRVNKKIQTYSHIFSPYTPTPKQHQQNQCMGLLKNCIMSEVIY